MHLLAIVFFTAFFAPLWGMKRKCVFKSVDKKEVKISRQKLNHAQLLDGLVEHGLDDSVKFLCKYSKEFSIPLKKLSHFQLLQNLFDQELEQPVELSSGIQDCFAKRLTLLLDIIPDSPTKHLKKNLLPKDFKTNL